MTTNMTIQIFVSTYIISGMYLGFSLKSIVPPNKKKIDRYHTNKFLNYEKYFFYYQRATAYRMLFEFHTRTYTIYKILGIVCTFITLYCAIDGNAYILLFSLISASSEIVMMIVPFQTYAKIYVMAARKMEYALNDDYEGKTENEVHRILEESYRKAEEIIQNDFM